MLKLKPKKREGLWPSSLDISHYENPGFPEISYRKGVKHMKLKGLRSGRPPEGDGMTRDGSEIMGRVVRDPIAAANEARDKYAASKKNWRHAKYEGLAVIFALGRHLETSATAWRKFSENTDFADRKHPLRPIKDQPNAMRFAAYWVLTADSEAKRDRAAAYVRGLQVLARRNVKADDVVSEIIKAGGIEKLINQAKMNTSSDGNAVKKKPAAGRQESRTARVVRGRDPAGRPTIEFEMTEGRQERFFGLRKGQEATVQVVGRGLTEEGWRRISVRKVTWKDH